VLVLLLGSGAVQCLKFEEGSSTHQQQQQLQQPQQQQQQQQQQNETTFNSSPAHNIEERRNGKHLLDFVGLGTGPATDPFLRKTNEQCLNGELSECFKSQALNTFGDMFSRDVYV